MTWDVFRVRGIGEERTRLIEEGTGDDFSRPCGAWTRSAVAGAAAADGSVRGRAFSHARDALGEFSILRNSNLPILL